MMMRIVVLAVAFSLPAHPARPALGALPAQDVSFRSASSELVVLPVVVTERTDQYVADLSQERFVVYDNGRRVAIDFFSSEDVPVTVGLVIDASGSMRKVLSHVIAAASQLARKSNPNDEIFAVWFNDDVHEAMPGRTFLMADDGPGLTDALMKLVPEGRTSLYDGLLAGLDHLDAGTRPRKVLVVFSDGGDNASKATHEQVLARARASNTTIYTIGLYDAMDPDKNPGVLKSLSSATGGERFLPKSPSMVLQAFEHIAREIRSGYTIGYVPPDRDGVFHRVRVEVTTPDKRKLTVRTRPGYFASKATS